ncbi:hypothetical protein [Desulfovibrio sp. UIB00]|uniref:hypothetical protein n=1 Tax=Desulfovibrio sp. UIB00 TaxID=2804314 RepID=UPI001F0F9A07|nr:hypothetical protein [Desulfovibrio sp. UIB00]
MDPPEKTMQAERVSTKVYQNSGSARLGEKSRTIYAALSDSGRQVDGTASALL